METAKAIAKSEIGRKVARATVETARDIFASNGGIGSMRGSINMLQKPDPRYMVPARQIVRMYRPNWDLHRTERMASFLLPQIQLALKGPEFFGKLTNSVESYKQALKSLADNNISSKIFDQHEMEFNRMYGAGGQQDQMDSSSSDTGGKLTLASSKTVDMNGSVLIPSPKESLVSSVEADLFSYQPVNEGITGALAIDEKRNEEVIRFRNLYEPRPYDAMDLMNLQSEDVWQWNHELPVDAIQQQAIEDFIIQQYLYNYAPSFQTQRYNLNDVNDHVYDSQCEGLRPDPNPFLPTNYREEFGWDMAGPLPLPMNNKPMRNILEPYGYGQTEWGPVQLLAMDTKPMAVQRYLMDGFDPIY